MESTRHEPVLIDEVLQFLQPKPGDVALDATLGTGGHTAMIAEKMQKGVIVGIDVDVEALSKARVRLNGVAEDVTIHYREDTFKRVKKVSHDLGIRGYDVVLADLGWGSHQLHGKGLSFTHNEPLDMRYASTSGIRALDVINTFSERDLEDIIHTYGEESWARRIAAFIVSERKQEPIVTTHALAELVARAVPRRFHPQKRHVATKTFQAFRIFVNDEIETLKTFLDMMRELMNSNGRFAVLSFHSLEDRVVKQTLLAWERDGYGKRPHKRGIRASEEEVARNPRARSALLRTFLHK